MTIDERAVGMIAATPVQVSAPCGNGGSFFVSASEWSNYRHRRLSENLFKTNR
jgi:hypothetical protein